MQLILVGFLFLIWITLKSELCITWTKRIKLPVIKLECSFLKSLRIFPVTLQLLLLFMRVLFVCFWVFFSLFLQTFRAFFSPCFFLRLSPSLPLSLFPHLSPFFFLFACVHCVWYKLEAICNKLFHIQEHVAVKPRRKPARGCRRLESGTEAAGSDFSLFLFI